MVLQLQANNGKLQSTNRELEKRRDQLASANSTLESLNSKLASRNSKLSSLNTTLSTHNDKLTHELALLRRHRFGKRSEGMDKQQLALLEALVDEDIAAIEAELAALSPKAAEQRVRKRAKRQPLPKDLPRTEIHHEPESTTCSCGCRLTRTGEDISEKLDYQPGTFSVERHIRGKWCCRDCDSLVQAPVAPHIIDKGIPTTNLLAQVLISKYADHLPLYRQEQQFARSGVMIPRSTLADWVGRCGVELTPLVERLRSCLLGHAVLHGDETPVPPQDVQPEEIDIAITVDRLERATSMLVARIDQRWAGLRSFVADNVPVVGYAPDCEGFFWCVGQGGYGIETSYGMGVTSAALAAGQPLPAEVADLGVTEEQLGPQRLWD